MSPRGGKLHRLLAVVLASTVFLLVAELAFRLFLSVSDIPYWTGDPMLGYRHQSHLSGRFVSGEHRARFHLNERGWNNPVEYSREKSQGVPRIAILGDSYVEGLQIDVERGVGPELSSLLSAHRGPVEVYTYGISGASTVYAHDLLENEVLADHPDCVVYLFIDNDVRDSASFLAGGQRWGSVYDLDDWGSLRRLPVRVYRPKLWKRALSRSALFRYFWINRGLGTAWQSGGLLPWMLGRNPREETADEVYRPPDARWRRAWEIVAGLMGEMSRRSRAVGADFMVVNRPHPANFYASPKSGDINLPESILKDSSTRQSFKFVDLRPWFEADWKKRGERFDFPGDSHWNRHGHRVAAQALAEILGGCAALRVPTAIGEGEVSVP